jgi:hypothetical protein
MPKQKILPAIARPEPDTSLWTPQQRQEWEIHRRAMRRYDSLSREELLERFVKTGVLNPDGTPTKHFSGQVPEEE